MTRSHKALVLGLAIVGIADTATAIPQKPHAIRTETVAYGDLDLQNEAGAATLLNRISKAAVKVCDVPPPGAANIHSKNTRFNCRETAMQNAVASVGHPKVTALYESNRARTAMKLASR